MAHEVRQGLSQGEIPLHGHEVQHLRSRLSKGSGVELPHELCGEKPPVGHAAGEAGHLGGRTSIPDLAHDPVPGVVGQGAKVALPVQGGRQSFHPFVLGLFHATHHGAPPHVGRNQPLGLEFSVGIEHGGAIHTQVLGQLALRRKPQPLGELPREDALPEAVADLHVDGRGALSVDLQSQNKTLPSVRRPSAGTRIFIRGPATPRLPGASPKESPLRTVGREKWPTNWTMPNLHLRGRPWQAPRFL
ncbi:MAG: hypothetical protein BWY88_01120 [Synergistetes bacterium ADurb.Bin520]|nr:MAG: hypothetical protein BWY88_01120 [Synergistetes bacterium ADurb.Bin520]